MINYPPIELFYGYVPEQVILAVLEIQTELAAEGVAPVEVKGRIAGHLGLRLLFLLFLYFRLCHGFLF